MTRTRSRSAIILTTVVLATMLAACSTPASSSATRETREHGSSTETVTPTETTTTTTTTTTSEAAPSREQAALDKLVASYQPRIPASIASFEGEYIDIRVESVPPLTLEYVYVYAHNLDPELAAPEFEKYLDVLQKSCDTDVFPAMRKAGVISDPKVRYTYENPDGTLVWSHTFSPS